MEGVDDPEDEDDEDEGEDEELEEESEEDEDEDPDEDEEEEEADEDVDDEELVDSASLSFPSSLDFGSSSSVTFRTAENKGALAIGSPSALRDWSFCC